MSAQTGKNSMSFEAAMERLDEVIAKLSDGGAGIEESMLLYCEGAELVARCEKELETAKLRMEKLFEESDA
jgi:exodeoxyribonuclease VII small subunit